METQNLILFIFLALLAEIAGTVGGFGSSLFFVPIAGYFFDFYSVLGITALFHVSSNLSKIFIFKKGFNKKIIINIGIPAVIFVITGSLLSKFIETKLLEIILSLFLIVVSLVLLFFKNLVIKPNVPNSIAGGVFSGFFAGLLGTGGAIRGIILSSFNLKMNVFIMTSAIIDLAVDFSRSIIYYFNGYMHSKDLYLVPILLITSIAGTLAGKKILMHVSEKQFKSTVLILVLITGIITLSKTLK